MRPVVRSAVAVLWALGVVAALAGCGSTKTVTRTVTVTTSAKTSLGSPSTWTEFGHIKTLKRSGGRWLMQFDPAWFLSGITANKAAAEDGVIAPGEPMPNDNYRVEEGHRLFTYIVPANARVTVLKRTGDQFGPTKIPVSELARIVDGTSTIKLFEPLDSGVWITIRGDKAVAIAHQYQP
jgi:hypothetical protein